LVSVAKKTGSGNSHQDFWDGLTPEEKMLIALRNELYTGSWDLMEHDLRERLNGRPYIFRLVARIEEDLKRIERLRGYETTNNMNLGSVLDGQEHDE
jgi:hypothetical protein